MGGGGGVDSVKWIVQVYTTTERTICLPDIDPDLYLSPFPTKLLRNGRKRGLGAGLLPHYV